jgi:hypothetical protein
MANRCPTHPGYKSQHKCDNFNTVKFELAIIQFLQKLAANAPSISTSSAAEELTIESQITL